MYLAHQPQTVGDLDDDDTRIFGHRHEHLTQCVGILLALPLTSASPLVGGVIWLGAALDVALGAAAQGNRRALKRIEAFQVGDGLCDLLAKRAPKLCAYLAQVDEPRLDHLIEQHRRQGNRVDVQRLGQCLGDRKHIGEVSAEHASRPLVGDSGAFGASLARQTDGIVDMRDIFREQIADDGLPQTLRLGVEWGAILDYQHIGLC